MKEEKELLINKTAIVTGASRGLGLEIAKSFVHNGANVIVCARNKGELDEAAAQLQECRVSKDQKVITATADTGKEADIDALITTATEAGGIDILVNNAAIQGPIGKIIDNDWDKWKETLAVDLVGPVYLMRRAIEYFTKTGKHGKIINISGGGATGTRPNFSAYAASKVALVRLTEILADEVKEYGIDINAIAPGAMRSAMTDEIAGAGARAGDKEIQTAQKLIENGDDCKEVAAKLALFLASDVSNGITGRLISAKWDKWDKFPDIKEELQNSDVYTLRRITARDRNLDWDK